MIVISPLCLESGKVATVWNRTPDMACMMCVLPFPTSPYRVEFNHIMKQKAIQAFTTSFSISYFTHLIFLLIFVPSVLAGNKQSISSYFYIHSLVTILRRIAISFVLRGFISTSEGLVSLRRIQVPVSM